MDTRTSGVECSCPRDRAVSELVFAQIRDKSEVTLVTTRMKNTNRWGSCS